MALDTGIGAFILGEDVRVKTQSEMRQAILDKYAKTIAQKKVENLTPMERAKYDAADELAKGHKVNVPTAHYFNKERVKQESVVTERLNAKILDAMNNTPDFKDAIAMDQGSLSKVAKFLEATDWDQFSKLEKDKAGYDRALLEIVKTAQAHGVRGKQKTINAIVDHRVANPIDKPKGFLKKAFALVMAPFRPKNIFAASAIMLAGASTNAVDHSTSNFVDIVDQVEEVITNDKIDTIAEPYLLNAVETVRNITEVEPEEAIQNIAFLGEALYTGVVGQSTMGGDLVNNGVVAGDEIVAETSSERAIELMNAGVETFWDGANGDISITESPDMNYAVKITATHFSLDGLFNTDTASIKRAMAVATQLGDTAFQQMAEMVQEANEQGFTPLMVDSGQMLTKFVQNNPEIMAQIDSAESERTRGEMIMMAALDIAKANNINMNQLTTGGVLMVSEKFDFDKPYPLQEIQAQNNKAGMQQFNR